MKKLTTLAVLAVSAVALSGCGNWTGDPTTEEPLPNSGMLNGTRHQVITNWTRVPSNSDVVSDIHIRILKIQDVCYVHTASEKDWQYSLVPTGRDCQEN